MLGLLCRSSSSDASDDGSYSSKDTASSVDSSGASLDEATSSDNGSSARGRRNDNRRYGIDSGRIMLLTVEDILFFGLSYVGFGEERQQVRDKLSVDRFKAHFGPEPRTCLDVLLDLKEHFGSDVIYKDVMMAMNWLKLCEFFLFLSYHLSRCAADFVHE